MEQQEQVTTYHIIRNLGSGYHACVKLGINQFGHEVAIKQYDPEKSQIDVMLNEVNILRSLDHPNIVKVIEWKKQAELTHRNGQKEICWAMIMEYFKGGELFHILKFTGAFSERITRTYFLQIISALDYMHQKGYTHRDLKPENILLSDKFELKIVDFGFSCLREGPNRTGILSRFVGTQQYMAPQVRKKKYQGTKVDIFAAGIILFIMYAGMPPFQTSTSNDLFYKDIKEKRYKKFWDPYIRNFNREYRQGYFSTEFQDLVTRMIAYREKERITMSQILQHPWVLGPTATQEEIYEELQKKKAITDKKMEEENKKQQRMEEQHVQNIQGNLSTMRSSGNIQNDLLNMMNQEIILKRSFRKINEKFSDDIVLQSKAKGFYIIARLKHLLNNLHIDLSLPQFVEIDYGVVPLATLLKIEEMKDDKENEIEVEFKCLIETDDFEVEEKVIFTVAFGKDEEQRIVIRLVKKNGDEYAFRRILDVVRDTFAYIAYKEQ